MQSSLGPALAAFRSGKLEQARELALAELQAGSTPELHHLIGLIDCRLGRPDSGVEWLKRASDARPGNLDFRIMLVRALVDSGRGEEAIEAAPRPAGTTPTELTLWQARAEAADAANRPDLAAEAWNRLCSARRADWRAWTNLGRNLLVLNRLPEAESAYRTALSINRDAEAFRQLGLVYERANRNDQLKLLLDEALAAGVAPAKLADLRAVHELRTGRPEEAARHLESADGDEPVRLHRLRARVADALHDSASAFEHSVTMNRATADFESWRDQSRVFREAIRRSADALTAGWAERLPQLPAAEAAPAFLLGFPRSGTTLLDTFLLGHPRIAVLEERGLLTRAAEAAGPLEALVDVSAHRLEALRDSYLSEIRGEVADVRAHVIDKAPLNMLLAPLMHVLFPDAPILFVQRHPCDAVLSGFMQSFTPNLGMASFLDIEDAAAFYDAAMTFWFTARDLLGLNVHTVVYEELVRRPKEVLAGVVDFLGAGWDDRMLDHQATAATRGPLTNTSYDQVTEPLTTRAIGRWHGYEKQLEPVLPLLLGWANRLGYPHP